MSDSWFRPFWARERSREKTFWTLVWVVREWLEMRDCKSKKHMHKWQKRWCLLWWFSDRSLKRTEKKEGVQEFSDWSKNLRLGIFQPCLVQVLAECNCFTKIPTSSAWEVYSLSGFLKYSFYSFTAIKPKRQWSAIEIEKRNVNKIQEKNGKNYVNCKAIKPGAGN